MKRYRRKTLLALRIKAAVWQDGLLNREFDALGVNPLQAGFDLQHIIGVKNV